MGSVHRMARLAVGDMGYGAGVDHMHVCRAWLIYQAVSGLGETPGQGLGVGLVQLAAVGLDEYGGVLF